MEQRRPLTRHDGWMSHETDIISDAYGYVEYLRVPGLSALFMHTMGDHCVPAAALLGNSSSNLIFLGGGGCSMLDSHRVVCSLTHCSVHPPEKSECVL